MPKKNNKYTYLYVIQGKYGNGWEDVDQSESLKDMKENFKRYQREDPKIAHRIIHRRELIIEEGDK
jgi:hypothetical protein